MLRAGGLDAGEDAHGSELSRLWRTRTRAGTTRAGNAATGGRVRLRRRGGGAAAAIALVLLLGGGAALAASPQAPSQTWVVSGPLSATETPSLAALAQVNAVAVSGTTAYVGGDFRYVGPETGGFVALDGSTGNAAGHWPVVTGYVKSAISDGSGGWFLAGGFTSVGGLPRTNLAHVLADGSVDTQFTASVNRAANALALSGETLYVGGTFTTANGSPRIGRRRSIRRTARCGRGIPGWSRRRTSTRWPCPARPSTSAG